MKMVNSPTMAGFPLIAAIKGMLHSCGTCGHGNVSIAAALKMAVSRYKSDPEFVDACRKLFPLPAMLGGVLVK